MIYLTIEILENCSMAWSTRKRDRGKYRLNYLNRMYSLRNSERAEIDNLADHYELKVR